MKPTNSLQKYMHNIELNACVLQIIVAIFLIHIKFLIYFEACSTPRLTKYVIVS